MDPDTGMAIYDDGTLYIKDGLTQMWREDIYGVYELVPLPPLFTPIEDEGGGGSGGGGGEDEGGFYEQVSDLAYNLTYGITDAPFKIYSKIKDDIGNLAGSATSDTTDQSNQIAKAVVDTYEAEGYSPEDILRYFKQNRDNEQWVYQFEFANNISIDDLINYLENSGVN
jgi:hypothetical protein